MTVAVLFGGMSCEHDISIITGVQTVVIAKTKFDVIPIYIDGRGRWIVGKRLGSIDTYKDKTLVRGKCVHIRSGDNGLYTKRGRRLATIDAAIICCHGINGEDGALQGLLQLSQIPYTGSGVRASAICLDKITTKKILQYHGLPVVPYVYFSQSQYQSEPKSIFATILDALSYPLIVKPASLGSSIGISIAKDSGQLLQSLRVAFELDKRVIVESALQSAIDINCAVVGGACVSGVASVVEQPLSSGDFLTYEDKYGNYDNKITVNNVAKLDDDLNGRIKDMAIQAFEALECSGVVRVDFLLDADSNPFVNEINTIPGSLSYRMFGHNNQMSHIHLIDYLLTIARCEHDLRQSCKTTYDSWVLQNVNRLASNKHGKG